VRPRRKRSRETLMCLCSLYFALCLAPPIARVLANEIEAGSGAVATAAAVGALVLLCDARWDGEDEGLLRALAATGMDLERLVRANSARRLAG